VLVFVDTLVVDPSSVNVVTPPVVEASMNHTGMPVA
jgi:hypothetical protein